MPKSESPFFRRTSSTGGSPAKSPARKKSTAGTEQRLDDVGAPPSLAPKEAPQDVLSLMRYILASAFEDMPDRAAGMNSERISEVLRFRERLPQIVSIAHLHALSSSPTATERELAQLVARGTIRKVVIPGRGKGGSAVGEGVVLVSDWKARILAESSLGDEDKEKYIALMAANPTTTSAQTSTLTKDEVRSLVQSGFLTSPSALSGNLSNLFTPPTLSSSPSSLSQSGYTNPTGTLAAVGGAAAIHDSGGSGSMLASSSTRRPSALNIPTQPTMTFALPATGAYLKLLTSTRVHLLALLKQLSPRYKEATWDLLHEKWDGNALKDVDAQAQQKRARGEWTGVLPGKTRKWREYWGLRFEWVLEECVGSGLVEVFDTGVGVFGVRAI